ncbi:MAG: metabolite traffic protein EboE [Pirellula sp.]|jgi:hypothetical protein|nr:metabolite traffic protein EboE [Pirellula sp.]
MDSPQLTSKTGYCMNVHAGRTFSEVLANLENYCARVRSFVGSPIGIGLWFSETSSVEALEVGNLDRLRSTLGRHSLMPFTLNGFPQGDFHQKVVKHAVYHPTWWETSRLEYTRKLVRILDAILPEGQSGSISTLPIAWGTPMPTSEQILTACKNLIFLAQELARLQESNGRYIVIAIEPEPGCYLTSTASFLTFYCDHLLVACSSEAVRANVLKHITICHDVCHAAVMFEDQSVELNSLFENGIRIGKVQVSSAISIPWAKMTKQQSEVALTQLNQFAEDRYLHQTTFGKVTATHSQPGTLAFQHMVEDLPLALNRIDSGFSSIKGLTNSGALTDEWRVHFHVPIFIERFGELSTTQSEIEKTITILAPLAGTARFPTGHFEIETYAWPVLPEGLKAADLASGIASEIEWFTTKARDLHR